MEATPDDPVDVSAAAEAEAEEIRLAAEAAWWNQQVSEGFKVWHLFLVVAVVIYVIYLVYT